MKFFYMQRAMAICAVIFATASIQAEQKSGASKGKVIFTLEDAYERTLDNLETFKINQEGILQAEAQYKEALSALYPQINAQVRDTYQNNQIGGVINTQRNRVDKTRFQAGFTLRQPVFSGFRESLLAESAEDELKALKLDDQRTRETLYKDVADLFFQIIYYQKDLQELDRNMKVLNDRIGELKEFVSLGKSRESDQTQSEADYQAVKVISAQELSLIRSSEELLAYLIGVPAKEFELKESDSKFVKTTLDTYISQAQERIDIKAAEVRENSAAKQLTAAEREGWPAINLDGTYNPVDKPNREHSESLSLTLTMPLFDGGRISARVDQRKHALESLKLRSQQVKRLAVRDVNVAYTKVISSENEIIEHKKAIAVAERALQEEREDYRQGVVNNLDVLQAISRFHEAKRNLLRSETALKQNQIELLVATGGAGK